MALHWPLVSNILVFLIDSVGISLILLVYFSNTKERINRIFVLMTFLMFVWVNFAFLSRWTGPTEWSLLWIKIAWSITPFLFSLIYYFVILFLKEKDKHKILTAINFFIGLSFVFIGLFTSLVIKNITYNNGSLSILYGKFVPIFFGAVFYYTILSFYLFSRRYKKTKDKKEKVKIKYLLAGLSFFFLMNGIFNIILPVFFKTVHLYEFGDYSTIVFLALIAYAIAKKELFGIRVIFTAFFVSIIILLFGLDILILTPSRDLRFYKIIILIVSAVFGYLLVRGSVREIRYREELKKAYQKEVKYRNKVKKAYEVEKKARKELNRLGDIKNQFIMASQHHLRTPLTSMRGYLDLILTGSYGPISSKVRGALGKFELSTKRLIKVVNEFLDITQFQMGKEVVTLRENTDLKPIFEEVEQELGFEANARGLKLEIKVAKSLPLIKADAEKLKIGMFNIVDNAIKYTKEGSVRVNVKKIDHKVLISVKDTGAGIPKESQKMLFDKLFERGESARRVHGTGKGIGLFITSHIIRAHKGKIWAESEGKGKGSTFFIELPIK